VTSGDESGLAGDPTDGRDVTLGRGGGRASDESLRERAETWGVYNKQTYYDSPRAWKSIGLK